MTDSKTSTSGDAAEPRTIEELTEEISALSKEVEKLKAENKKTDFDVTKIFVCLFVAPVASHSLFKIYFSDKSHVPEIVPLLVAGAGLCLQHPSMIVRAWRTTKKVVTLPVMAAKKGLISLKTYGQRKKAKVKVGFHKCANAVGQRTKAMQRITRKLINKIRGVEPL